MVLSWFCVAGRIPVSDLSGDFTCHTYPVYKPIDSNQYKTKGMGLSGKPLQLLPLENAAWKGAPWQPDGPFGGDTAFTLAYIFMSASMCIGVGLAVSWREGKRASGQSRE